MAWKRARGTTAQAQTIAPTERETATRTIAQRDRINESNESNDESRSVLVPEDPEVPDHQELHRWIKIYTKDLG